MNTSSGPTIATLTGLAVGDALGMPFETKPLADPDLLSWQGPGDYRGSAYHKLAPGQWTDDTMMARNIAESLVEWGDFNPADLSKRYVAWLTSGVLRGMGETTKTALGHLQRGCPWVHSGISGAEGNGPASRVAPIGIFYRRNLTYVAKVARQEASITHDSEICREGAAAVALGIALIARGDFHDHEQNLMAMVVENLNKTTQIKYGLIAAAARAKRHYDYPWVPLSQMGTGAHMLKTVPAAFFAFASTRDYKGAIEAAIRAGGDTDTTAAIAGALAGTFYGIVGVAPYLHALEDGDALRALEQRLFTTSPRGYDHAP